MAKQQAGFKIKGKFYPSSTGVRMRDPVLVEAVTGLRFDDFAKRSDDLMTKAQSGKEVGDLVVALGNMAMAIWQAHPEWSIEEVVKFCESTDFDTITWIMGDDASPPVPAPKRTAKPSSTSSDASTPVVAEQG